jgi:hypothetical protein
LLSAVLAADDLADYHPSLQEGIDYDVILRREIVFDENDDPNTAFVEMKE